MEDYLDDAPCGFVSFRDDGTIIVVNTTLKEWLGYSGEALEGHSLDTILTISTRIFYNTHFFPLIKLHGKAEEIFITLLKKNREHVPVLANAVRRLRAGNYENDCVVIPVYQRKKYEDEILQAKKEAEEAWRRSEMLTSLTEKLQLNSIELDRRVSQLQTVHDHLVSFNKIITHDFQEAIRKIDLYTQMVLHNEGQGKRDPVAALTRVLRASAKLRQLTVALETFISLDHQKTRGMVDLPTVVQAAHQRAAATRDFFDFDLHWSGLPMVEGFEEQLEVLFFHLIDNAIVYRHTERRLVVSVSGVLVEENIYRTTANRYQYVDCVKITVSDNGRGFNPEYRDYVFSLLKKIDTESHGLGMGLALAKKVVDNHFGSIRASSEPGSGTAIVFTLPLRFSLP
jgi:phosphoserine phosphatase RsbU/P